MHLSVIAIVFDYDSKIPLIKTISICDYFLYFIALCLCIFFWLFKCMHLTLFIMFLVFHWTHYIVCILIYQYDSLYIILSISVFVTDYLDSVIGETLKKVSVSTTFAQSRLVLVSTSYIFLVLEESRPDTFPNFRSRKVSVSTSFVFFSLADSLSI